MTRAIPCAVAVVAAIAASIVVCFAMGATQVEFQSMCVLASSAIGMNVVARQSQPFTVIRAVLFAVCTAGLLLCVFGFGHFLMIVDLPSELAWAVAIITVAVMLLLHVFLKKTKTGLRMYSVGENYAAAMLHGISKKKALLISFMLGGALIGAAGVLQASYSYGASTMSTTLDFLLQALAASLLGTTFSRTEELSVIGTAISALFISSLSSALIANGVSNLLQPGLLGPILVVSVMLTVIKKREIGQVTIF